MTTTIEKTETTGVAKQDGKAQEIVMTLTLGGAEPCPKKSISSKAEREKVKIQNG